MKIKHKYQLIRLLMLVSLLMMTGFSGYWLFTQYESEKSILTENLQQMFTDAGEEVLDSLLLAVYIKPALNDSIDLTIDITEGSQAPKPPKLPGKFGHVIVEKDTLADTSVVEKVIVERDTTIAGGPQRIQVFHSSKDTAPKSEFLWKEEEMLVRSFKLVMSHTSDEMVTDSIQLINMDGNGIHASMLMDLFRAKMEEDGLPLMVDWVNPDSAKTMATSHDQLFIRGKSLIPSDTALISGVMWFTLKEILPQLLFVTVLLGLSFTAFLLMFRTMKKQYELNLARQDLVSNMTHELKTPVSTMKVALEALNVFSASKDPVAAKEYTTIANQEINRLDQLISRMLDMVSLEGMGKMNATENADLYDIIDDVLETLKPRMNQQSATVVIKKQTDSALLFCNRFYLETAVSNMIDNSLKYGGSNTEITISVSRPATGKLRLEILDNGPGVPLKYAKKIFEKFFRVPTGDVHDVKGHGLGLSFAAQVMKQLGGRIYQENLPEGGSRFVMQF